MNLFVQRAAEYLGINIGDQLSKSAERRLRAKTKKLKKSYKKTERKKNLLLINRLS